MSAWRLRFIRCAIRDLDDVSNRTARIRFSVESLQPNGFSDAREKALARHQSILWAMR